jgi:transcriptional regulator with XRE-family HTH domain
MTKIAEALRVIIQDGGWTQEEAARRLGITQSQVSQYLNGTREPSLHTGLKMATALGVPFEKLMGFPEAAIPRPDPDYIVLRGWFQDLRHRWKRRPADRPEIEAGVRLLWRESAVHVLAWILKP